METENKPVRNKLILAGIIISIILSTFTLIFVQNNRQSVKTAIVAEVGNAPTKGSGDALVTIIEFSDFECPFCLKFQKETLPKIEERYGDRVRFAYKHFPLTDVHPQAMNAAIASSCIYFLGGEDAFFEYHNILFNQVAEWVKDEAKFLNYAEELGFDKKQFTACVQSDGAKRWVDKDIGDGRKLEVEGVPTFFVNGKKITEAQPFEYFVKVIDEELNNL